jgi:hypothetical protein
MLRDELGQPPRPQGRLGLELVVESNRRNHVVVGRIREGRIR